MELNATTSAQNYCKCITFDNIFFKHLMWPYIPLPNQEHCKMGIYKGMSKWIKFKHQIKST